MRWSKEKVRRRCFTYKWWDSDWNLLAAKNHEIIWLLICLEVFSLINTNIFGFWITWFGVEMRELWSKQEIKNHEEISVHLIFNFSSLMKWREGKGYLNEGSREIQDESEGTHHSPLWEACKPHGALLTCRCKVGLWPMLASLALLSRSSAVFGPPNSNFESVFGLQIVTPSRTKKTIKPCKMVENSTRYTWRRQHNEWERKVA